MTVHNLFGRSDTLHRALYLDRPNRFVVRCDLKGSVVTAHCANPGRMIEILVPGTTLLLQKKPKLGRTAGRLEYSLMAAWHRGILVPLVSNWANDLAEKIVLPLLFPAAVTMRREVKLGNSRLDFLLEIDNRQEPRAETVPRFEELYLEVKGCTLIEEGTAMFPDAPTLRGLKHLGELETLAAQGRPAEGRLIAAPQVGILFILMNPQARRFVPNLHTDPEFTRKLIDLERKIWMRAVSIHTGEDGSATVANPEVPIDLRAAEAVRQDSGAYLLSIEVRQKCTPVVGSLGEILFDPGWYVYVGSGRKNLSARIARHRRRRKKLHWHIDYLLACVQPRAVTGLPIRSSRDLECELARAVAIVAAGSPAAGSPAAGSIPGFGSTDCVCSSHLFRFEQNPLKDRRFLDLVVHYRHSAALACSS